MELKCEQSYFSKVKIRPIFVNKKNLVNMKWGRQKYLESECKQSLTKFSYFFNRELKLLDLLHLHFSFFMFLLWFLKSCCGSCSSCFIILKFSSN